jgi:hypothetical protein
VRRKEIKDGTLTLALYCKSLNFKSNDDLLDILSEPDKPKKFNKEIGSMRSIAHAINMR